jgi:hypothetical protein
MYIHQFVGKMKSALILTQAKFESSFYSFEVQSYYFLLLFYLSFFPLNDDAK